MCRISAAGGFRGARRLLSGRPAALRVAPYRRNPRLAQAHSCFGSPGRSDLWGAQEEAVQQAAHLTGQWSRAASRRNQRTAR
eukprot:scaffold107756_cov25-Tisochrysis_lutea.AAC.1